MSHLHEVKTIRALYGLFRHNLITNMRETAKTDRDLIELAAIESSESITYYKDPRKGGFRLIFKTEKSYWTFALWDLILAELLRLNIQGWKLYVNNDPYAYWKIGIQKKVVK